MQDMQKAMNENDIEAPQLIAGINFNDEEINNWKVKKED